MTFPVQHEEIRERLATLEAQTSRLPIIEAKLTAVGEDMAVVKNLLRGNGYERRVSSLERWRAAQTGALALLSILFAAALAFGVPLVLRLVGSAGGE